MTRGNSHNVFSMAALDMSLDEITSSNANRGDNRGQARGRGRGRGMRRGRGDGGGRNRGSGQGRGRGTRSGRGSGGQITGRFRGSGSTWNRGNVRKTTSIRGQSIKRGSRPPLARNREIGGRNLSNIETTGKVIVNNLGTHVTSDDVKEIFEKIGTITQAFVKFDKTGKSTGSAEVVYARKEDARKAQRDLNGAQVDGVSINVTLSSQSVPIFQNGSSRGRPQFSNRMNNNMSRGRGFGRNNDNNNYNPSFNNQRHPLDRLSK